MVKKLLTGAGMTLGVLLLWILIFLVGVLGIIFRGPSPAARDLLLATVMETSAAKFVAHLYFSNEEIAEILAANALNDGGMITDGGGVNVPAENATTFDPQQIEVKDIVGSTFKGKMMIVNDPSRLYVATPTTFDKEVGGLRVEEMVKRDGATAGINAGGFADLNGIGKGGEPLGFVIQKGIQTFGRTDTHGSVIGFDRDHKLVVGKMSAAQALARGVRDAVTFDPVGALVINGQAVSISGTGGGLNPRTAIGQRADGAVLLLTIDGRQANSIGASYKDLIDVMLNFGAVNAANLDGGSSTLMVYHNEIINVCASLYGSRKLPTAILVK